MIRITRGAEPAWLADIRAAKIGQAIQRLEAGAEPRGLTGDGYQNARDQLFRNQRKKCAYCDRRVGLESQAVEHFRPKMEAWRITERVRDVDPDRYWWFAWTWENLLFACSTCNNRPHKGNWFPLADGTAPLPLPTVHALPDGTKELSPNSLDVSLESPLLIDPTRVDPLDHLRWRPIDSSLRWDRQRWQIEGTSPGGHRTVQVLKLDRLEDDVNARLRVHVLPPLRGIVRRVGQGGQARGEWTDRILPMLRSNQDYAGATWSIVSQLHTGLDLSARAGIPAPPRP